MTAKISENFEIDKKKGRKMQKKWKNTKKIISLAILWMLAVAVCCGCTAADGSAKKGQDLADVKTENAQTENAAENIEIESIWQTEPIQKSETTDSGEDELQTQMADSAREEEKFTFPMLVDSERLEVTAVFGYTGMNPDAENVYAENIAAIQLKNKSGQYVKKAQITLTLSNGDVLNMELEDIPAEMEALAFEIDNKDYDDHYRIEEISVQSEYEAEKEMTEVSYKINGNQILVKNLTNEKINNVTIDYHCAIDGIYYGGKAFHLQAGEIEAGGEVSAVDENCFVGDIAVVNIAHE